MKKVLLVGIIAVLLIAGSAFLFLHHSKNSQTAGNAAPPPPAYTAVIEITKNGFTPKTVAVDPNTDVIWVNEDLMPHLPAADPYPDHSSLPNLIAPRALGQKETYSFLFTKKRTVGYHDQINPTLTGEIQVR